MSVTIYDEDGNILTEGLPSSLDCDHCWITAKAMAEEREEWVDVCGPDEAYRVYPDTRTYLVIGAGDAYAPKVRKGVPPTHISADDWSAAVKFARARGATPWVRLISCGWHWSHLELQMEEDEAILSYRECA